ncbi:MAG: ABC transporter permease [Anaerolineae bacterium]|nr:ABC transporter permease [Anaerolineae bacterium]MBL6966722.1 ABC transporter permease [Anaerolineales bacterium]
MTVLDKISSQRKRTYFWQGVRARMKPIHAAWGELRRHPLGVIGMTLIVIFALMVVAHPLLMKTIWSRVLYDPYLGFDSRVVQNPSPSSARHLLGTDGMGRDVLSQLLYGARMSFNVGITAALFAVTLSTLFGGMAGYFGGVIDLIMMGISDVFVLLPALVIMLIIGLLVRLDWFLIALIFGILTGLGSQAMVVKSHTLSIRSKPYIEAARTAGGGHFHILWRHILPGLMPLALVHAVMTVVGAVLTESLLSFFSRTHDYMTWGSMIWLGQRTFRWFNEAGQWNALIPPALAIMFFCSAFYLVGRALDDIVNPRLRQR